MRNYDCHNDHLPNPDFDRGKQSGGRDKRDHSKRQLWPLSGRPLDREERSRDYIKGYVKSYYWGTENMSESEFVDVVIRLPVEEYKAIEWKGLDRTAAFLQGVGLTKDAKETTKARFERDPEFAAALLEEAASLFRKGELETARLILRDLVDKPTPLLDKVVQVRNRGERCFAIFVEGLEIAEVWIGHDDQWFFYLDEEEDGHPVPPEFQEPEEIAQFVAQQWQKQQEKGDVTT